MLPGFDWAIIAAFLYRLFTNRGVFTSKKAGTSAKKFFSVRKKYDLGGLFLGVSIGYATTFSAILQTYKLTIVPKKNGCSRELGLVGLSY